MKLFQCNAEILFELNKKKEVKIHEDQAMQFKKWVKIEMISGNFEYNFDKPGLVKIIKF